MEVARGRANQDIMHAGTQGMEECVNSVCEL